MLDPAKRGQDEKEKGKKGEDERKIRNRKDMLLCRSNRERREEKEKEEERKREREGRDIPG